MCLETEPLVTRVILTRRISLLEPSETPHEAKGLLLSRSTWSLAWQTKLGRRSLLGLGNLSNLMELSYSTLDQAQTHATMTIPVLMCSPAIGPLVSPWTLRLPSVNVS